MTLSYNLIGYSKLHQHGYTIKIKNSILQKKHLKIYEIRPKTVQAE